MMSKYIKKLKTLKVSHEFSISVKTIGDKKVKLRVLTAKALSSKKTIHNLAIWRDKNSYWFGDKFKVTNARTKKWLRELVLQKEDRILFMIEDSFGKQYGHLGFNRYNGEDNSCELDNVVRGIDEIPGLMTDCVKSILRWAFKNLGIDYIYLTTFADNDKAVGLYRRCGFKIKGKIPLKDVKHNGNFSWQQIDEKEKKKSQRYYLRMKLKSAI